MAEELGWRNAIHITSLEETDRNPNCLTCFVWIPDYTTKLTVSLLETEKDRQDRERVGMAEVKEKDVTNESNSDCIKFKVLLEYLVRHIRRTVSNDRFGVQRKSRGLEI